MEKGREAIRLTRRKGRRGRGEENRRKVKGEREESGRIKKCKGKKNKKEGAKKDGVGGKENEH